MIYACTTGLVFVLSLLAADVAIAEAPKAAHEQPAAATASSIHYQDGRLSARIANRPLQDVLRELSAATGARFVLSNAESGPTLVSAAVESQPFLEGVKTILRGFSYVIYSRNGADLPTVKVLSAGQTAGAPSARTEAGFRSPMLPSLQADSESKADQSETLASEQAEQETLDQAIAALNSQQGQPHQQTLDQLVGSRDPRATQALVQAALGTQDSRIRAQVTEALWHHAADLEFTDGASVSALEQLADDADAEVQRTARQALQDRQQYLQHNP